MANPRPVPPWSLRVVKKRSKIFLYHLRFAGKKTIELGIHDGQTLKKVFLNGRAIPFKVEDSRLKLQVTPARIGDHTGRLELLLGHPPYRYDLSGKLRFNGRPRLSGVNAKLGYQPVAQAKLEQRQGGAGAKG